MPKRGDLKKERNFQKYKNIKEELIVLKSQTYLMFTHLHEVPIYVMSCIVKS